MGLAVALGYMGVYGRIPGLDIFVWFVSDLGPRDRVLLSPSTTRCSAGYVTCTSGSPSTHEAHLCQDRQRLFAPSLSIDRLCRRPPSSTSPQCAAQTLGKATLIPGVPPSSPQHPVDITPSAPAGTKLRTRMRLLVKRHNLQYECMRTNTSQCEAWWGVRTHTQQPPPEDVHRFAARAEGSDLRVRHGHLSDSSPWSGCEMEW